ncbi:MAG: MFS transporter [Betaproteobacteria bacterium]|nr:MAG: MFS transporter [Betaproteobacteria bacterium]
METAKKNVAVLAACQALLFTNNSTAIALNGLAGYALAANKALATLPVTAWVIGGALSTLPASLLMKRVGRRAGFTVGALVGMVGATVCSLALYLESFWLFCFGTMVFGVYNAAAQYYRFAAADVASADFKAKAISLVLAGGLVGGIVGPETSKLTVDLLQTPYLGAYLSLIGFLVPVVLALQWLDIPAPAAAAHKEPARPLAQIMAQPVFVVAVLAAAIAYGVMNLLMTATPLAMGICGHPYRAAATVIGWHVIGMFGPSFFTGSLIRRFGVLQVMFAGALLLYVVVAIALSGVSIPHFWLALVLLGVGWNFLYIGGTTLITEACTPPERAKTQGANDLIIFVVMATSSFSSGLLLEKSGWQMLNYFALPFVTAAAIALLWLLARHRFAAGA